jgi:hypothetical protein
MRAMSAVLVSCLYATSHHQGILHPLQESEVGVSASALHLCSLLGSNYLLASLQGVATFPHNRFSCVCVCVCHSRVVQEC